MFARTFSIKQFSTAAKVATKEVSHTPPRKLIGLTGRYAGALYTAASKGNALDKVEVELMAISQSLKKSTSFAAFLYNPTVPRAEKVAKVITAFHFIIFKYAIIRFNFHSISIMFSNCVSPCCTGNYYIMLNIILLYLFSGSRCGGR